MNKFKPGEVVVLDAPDDDPLCNANGQSVTIDRVVIEMTANETEVTYYFKAFYKGPNCPCVTPEYYLVKPEKMLTYRTDVKDPEPDTYRQSVHITERQAMQMAIDNAMEG